MYYYCFLWKRSYTYQTSFIFSFFTPYLLNAPYADLGSKVGFIFGGLAVCSFAFAFLCVPEMKGKSLEDINQLFEDRVPIMDFGKISSAKYGENRGDATLGFSEVMDKTVVS